MNRLRPFAAPLMLILLLFFSGCLWKSPRSGMSRKRLQEPQVIQGVPCSAGYAWTYDDDTLGSCTLSRDARLESAELPEGTTVFFRRTGELDYCFFPQLTEFQGYPCSGHGMVGAMTGLYPSGKLRYFWPPEPIKIGQFTCKGAVGLHENGNLRVCKLAADATVGEATYGQGRVLNFDEAGDLIQGGN